MNVTLANGTVLNNVVNVEEMFSSRMDRKTTLSIRLRTDRSVDELKAVFTPEATSAITVDGGDNNIEITGYTAVDSIRRIWDGRTEYNASVDLVRGTGDV